jgi:hypothetical protein
MADEVWLDAVVKAKSVDEACLDAVWPKVVRVKLVDEAWLDAARVKSVAHDK